MLLDLIQRIQQLETPAVKDRAKIKLTKKIKTLELDVAALKVLQLDFPDLHPGCQLLVDFFNLEQCQETTLSQEKIQELHHHQLGRDFIVWLHQENEHSPKFYVDSYWMKEMENSPDVPEIIDMRRHLQVSLPDPPQWFIDQLVQSGKIFPKSIHWVKGLSEEAKHQGIWPLEFSDRNQ